jgi:multidrug efflux system outer membrane protein
MFEIKPIAFFTVPVILVMLGCSGLPPLIGPGIKPAAAFSEAPASPAAPVAPLGGNWWRLFNDQHLDTLIETALTNNMELAGAEARLAKARAAFHAALAALHPETALSGIYSRTRPSQESAQPYQVENSGAAVNGLELKPREHSQYALSHPISYEFDLFGRLRHNRNAAHAEVAAGEADRCAARLLLTTQVAASWYQLISTDRHMQAARKSAALADEALALQQSRFESGIAAADSMIPFEHAAADAHSLASRLAATRARQIHALAELCGFPDGRLPVDCSGQVLPAVPRVPSGVPAAVLERRPDIISKTAKLQAAAERIGAAHAAFFPQISLTGNFGFQSEDLKNLISGGARTWSFSPQISLPLFDGGRNRAALESAQSAYAAAAASYRGQVYTALREVDDALSDGRELDMQIRAADTALASARRNLISVSDRFEQGFVTKNEVISARMAVIDRECARTVLQGEHLLAEIALIQALGGGWSVPEKTHARHRF